MGAAARRRDAWATWRPARRRAACARGRWSTSWPEASWRCSRRAQRVRAPVGADERRPGRVSVQGSGQLRGRGRAVLLRARAARRGAGRAARRRAAARGRRALGQWQVVRGASRAAARAGGRRAARGRRLDAGADPAGRAADARAAQHDGRDWMQRRRAGRRSVRGDLHGLSRRAASATPSSPRFSSWHRTRGGAR